MLQHYLDLRGYQAGQLTPAELFFVLLWREMFSSRSLDAWQPRTANARICLEELLEVIHTGRYYAPYLNNVEHLLAELKRQIPNDPVIPKKYAFVRRKEYLGQFFEGRVSEKSFFRLAGTVRVVMGNLGDYVDQLVDTLARILVEEPKAKKKISALALALGTELSSRGYAPRFLDEQGTAALLDTTRRFDERLRHLVAICNGERHKYQCTLKTDLAAFTEVTLNNVSLTKGTPQEIPDGPAAEFYTNAANSMFVHVDVEAVDPYAALVAAEDRLEEVCSAIDLYTPQHAVQRPSRDALVAEDGSSPQKADRDDSHKTYWQNATKPDNALARLLDVLDHLPQRHAERLTALLQYHRLALASERDEGRLVNLWIALESLVRGHGDTIISAATSVVPPIVALENTRQHIVAVATYIRQSWRRGNRFGEFEDLLSRSSKRRLDPLDLLDILLGPKERSQKLCELCKDHPLVLHRIAELHRDLKSPKAMSCWLRRQHDTVNWQLRRIYRARNTIIHTGGSCSQSNTHLNQHLHSYLMQTAHRVIRDVRWHEGAFGLDDAINHRRHLYQHVLKTLDEQRSVPRTALIEWGRLLSGSPVETAPAWETAKDNATLAESAPPSPSRDATEVVTP